MYKTILITGGAGFIGANFVHYWHRTYPASNIILLDALTYAGRKENLSPLIESGEITFVHGSICDEALVKELFIQFQFDCVMNFAAESHVDRSIAAPDIFVEANVTGTHTLLKAARSAWKKHTDAVRFHHISTDEVYGSLAADDPAFCESTPYAPNSPYSASKAASDHFVRAYHETYGLPVTISNCSNNYGPLQHNEKLIPTLISNALNGESLPIYGDGKNSRDWLHVVDHCAGIKLILEKGVIGETYIIGTRNEQTNLNIVKLLARAFQEVFVEYPEFADSFSDCPAARGESVEALITFVEDRLGHDRRYAINPEKIERSLGFKSTIPFYEGLKETIYYYAKQHVPSLFASRP